VEVVRDLLKRDGFSVEATTDSMAALEKLKQDPNAFDVLVTDNDMPRLHGKKLIEMAWLAGFKGKSVLHSGSLEQDDGAKLLHSADAIVAKPFDTCTLGAVLRSLLG
jgi:CheY-like chemotaxis protein